MAPSCVIRPRNNPLSTQCGQRARQTDGIRVTKLLRVTPRCRRCFLVAEAQEPRYRIDLQPDTSSDFCLNPYGASLLSVC